MTKNYANFKENSNNLIKGSTGLKKWKAIYRLLYKVSPVPFDCGAVCGAICCSPEDSIESKNLDSSDLGIYLFPGEFLVHDDHSWIDWSFEDASDDVYPDSWSGKVGFIKCKTPPKCPREKRPLQCRTYPVAPYIDDNNKLHLIYYPHFTPYDCPIIYNEMEISSSFLHATYTVWKHLLRDSLTYDLIKDESLELEKEDIKIVYSSADYNEHKKSCIGK